MPFNPHLIVQLKEAVFVKSIEAIEKNTLKEHFNIQLPDIKQVNNNSPQEPDAANSSLIKLYDLLLQLIQKSHDGKNKGYNSEAYLKSLSQLAVEVHQHALSLREQPELWSYLLGNKKGRLVFYYLIYLNLIHQDCLNLASSTRELLKALEEHGCSDSSEHLMLKFLGFRFDRVVAKQSTALVSVDERVNNPFINAYWLLQNLAELPSMSDKVDVALTLTDRTVSFNQAIPAFIVQFIQLQYATLFITGMGSDAAALQQVAVAKKLSERGYLPASIQQSNDSSSLQCVNQVTDLVYSVYRVLYSFSLYNDPGLMLRHWHTNLMFFQVLLYYQMMHALPEDEVRIYKARITQQESLAHLTTALNLVKFHKQAPTYASDPKSQERMNLFWTAAKSLLCPVVLVQPDYVRALSQHIQLIGTAFVNQGRLADVCDIFAAVIEFQELFHNLSPKDHAFYSNLLRMLRFITELPNPFDDNPKEAVRTLLAQVEARKYVYRLTHHELEKIHPELQKKVASIFLSKLAFLIGQVDKAVMATPAGNQCYLLLQQVAESLAIPQQEFAAIFSSHNQIEEWDDYEDETRQKKPSVKKKSKKVYSASAATSVASSPNFFKPAEVDATLVSPDAIPQAIWEFAEFIHNHTGNELILGGGAAAFLYLKKRNPRDYDFLLLNVPKEGLLKLLQQHGYRAQLVGGQVPVIKLKLETASGVLNLDLNTEMAEPSVPLTKTMEGILSRRDFKLSALYVVLQRGAKYLEVKGFDHAIRSLNNKLISVVNHNHNLFIDEPPRLLRLVKICLQYPDFRLDDELQLILRKTDLKGSVGSYLTNPAFAQQHRGKISTSLELLLERFNIGEVLKVMNHLGVFSALTDLNYEDFEKSLPLLEPYNAQDAYAKKRALMSLVHMHYVVAHPDAKKLNAWPFYGVARCVKPGDQAAFNAVEVAVFNKSNMPEGELKNWLGEVQAIHQKSAESLASCVM